jgi:hypothetical protein
MKQDTAKRDTLPKMQQRIESRRVMGIAFCALVALAAGCSSSGTGSDSTASSSSSRRVTATLCDKFPVAEVAEIAHLSSSATALPQVLDTGGVISRGCQYVETDVGRARIDEITLVTEDIDSALKDLGLTGVTRCTKIDFAGAAYAFQCGTDGIYAVKAGTIYQVGNTSDDTHRGDERVQRDLMTYVLDNS